MDKKQVIKAIGQTLRAIHALRLDKSAWLELEHKFDLADAMLRLAELREVLQKLR